MVVIRHNPLAQQQFVFDLARWSLSSVLMVATILCHLLDVGSDILDISILFVAMVQELVTWIASRTLFRHRFTYPIDLDLMQSRWGVWVMIVVSNVSLTLFFSLSPSLSLSLCFSFFYSQSHFSVLHLCLMLIFCLCFLFSDWRDCDSNVD